MRTTPRFARIVGDDFFTPPDDEPLDVDELVDSYLTMTANAPTAHRVDDVLKRDAARGLALAVEIIHRGENSFDTFGPLQDVIDAHGDAVIGAVEEIAATSARVRRALWRMKARERNIPPREGPVAEVWRRAIAAHGTTTDFTDDDAPSPAPRQLSADDEALLRAWFTYREHFAAFEILSELDAETTWPVILRLLDRADGQTIFAIAAGPLEDLLAGQGMRFIDRIAEEARRNAKLREALTGVWLNEGDEVWPRFQALMEELNPGGGAP